MDVYFDDFDDKSGDYFRLDYDPSFSLHAGKNLIAIRGNSDTMNIGTELIIEAIDANGNVIRTQIYDLNNDAHERVISIEITPETPAGDVIFTIVGSARVAPDGGAIPPDWRGVPNMKWTRVFTAKTHMPNRSPITYNDSLPEISITEISKPFFKLHFNSELSTSVNWQGNSTASYILKSSGSGHNTNTKVSYQKNGGKYFITAHDSVGGSILDFGGFTQDMAGGILIVRNPEQPRPSSINGYASTPVYAENEIGDGLYENQSFNPGGYMTTIEEVISPFEARTSEPHTTYQGLTAATYQEFEHFEFANSDFELIWSQMPISYSADPTGSQGEELRNSYALVKFDNLEPLTGDVTRIKCYMKNHQAPFDWVLASDNAVWCQELLYRKDYEKHRYPTGDFSQWGVGTNTGSLEAYWETEGIGTPNPSMSIYTQGGAGENPPAEDNLQVGTNEQAWGLDGTAYWWLHSKESASFYEDQYYELSFKAVSIKTILPSWQTLANSPILEPKLKLYMTGSAFTDGTDSFGKYVGKIEDIASRKKHVEFDQHDNEKEIGYKFIFKADGTETGKPCFKIESGVWHFWDISIRPWDRKGYTPGTWDVIFPTIKANVGNPDALDFKFEFYNDYGQIANYTAVINKVPWVNEYTTVFTHVHTNLLNITQTASFDGTVEFNGTASFFSMSDGYSPTGSSGSMHSQAILTITGSGGISTSYFEDPSNSSIRGFVIDGGSVTGGGGGGGWTASAGGGGGTTAVNPGENFTIQMDATSGNIGAAYLTSSGVNTTVTLYIPDTNVNTQLSAEQVQDIVGAMVTGNTEAGITVSYQDSDGTLDFNVPGAAGWNPMVGGSNTLITAGEYLKFSAGTGMTITGIGGAGTIGNPHEITFNSLGMGGSGGSGCFTHYPYDPDGTGYGNDIPGYRLCVQNTLMQEMPAYYAFVYSGSHIECPTTVGFGMQHFFYPEYSAEYQNNYSGKTWFQVNNWTQGYEDHKTDIEYAAIFNTTGNPVTPLDNGDNCCDDHAVAGHGIKIQTSTIPVGVSYKIPNKTWNGIVWTMGNTCDATQQKYPGPFVGSSYMEPKWREWPAQSGYGNVTSGLANAYYLTFYHWDPRCNSNQVGRGIFAGGIRKDCDNPENTIVIEYSSDKRLKKNIEDTKWSIDDLMKIKVRDFNWKTINSSPKKSTGFIAQELQEVYPQAAHGNEYGDINEDPMTVSPDRLIPLLVKSVQDQNKVIQSLTERLNKLENK